MKKKLLSLLLAFVMTFSMAMPAMAAEGSESGKIVILHTNDIHCGIDQETNDEGEVTNLGYTGVAAYKAAMEETYGAENVTLVDVGDAIQGGPIGTLSKGAYVIDIMNQVGYDLAIPGNHEFDYGMENYLSLVNESAEYDYLCANFTDLEGNPVHEGYKVLTYGDVKVGYVGIDTPESFTKSTPTYFQDAEGNYIYSFSQGNEGADLYAVVQKAIDAAKSDGADYVVALAHLGIDEQSAPWTSTEVIANTTGIDVLLDGHSHSTFVQTAENKDGEVVQMAQTGTKLANLGKVVIDTETKEITCELVAAKDCTEQDSETLAVVEAINAEFADVLQEVVAKTDVALTVNNADGVRAVRSAETNLGDLCADAYRIMLGADIAFVNGGGVRADIPAGEITYEQIINVHPFGNEACMVETTGQKILDALEMGARVAPEENGGFLQVSGLTYTIDTTIASGVVLNDEKEFVSVEGARRVKDVEITGVAIDPEKTYTLASHNYMLKDGGDGFVMFKSDKLIKDSVMIDNQVLINYMIDELGGVVSQDYADIAGQGRIAVKYVGVDGTAWYADAAKYVIDAGMMSSTGNGFDPRASVTRGTVFQTLYNAEGKPAAVTTFTDVEGKWYAAAAAWAESTGIATVGEDQLFNGDRAITRGEIAAILARYADYKVLGTAGDTAAIAAMADYDQVPAWALDGMTFCFNNGIISGKPGDLLDTAGSAIRAELATMLMNSSKLESTPAEQPDPNEKPSETALTGKAATISKYGNVTTDLAIADCDAAGHQVGDILKVTVGDVTLDVPYGTGYSNVDNGCVIALADTTTQTMAVAINMGNFAEIYGVAEGTEIVFDMGEKAGYLEEYEIRNIDSLRTNERDDYASDEVFANFRAVVMGDIAQGVLYRSSSPVNPELGRNSYVDAMVKAAGIQTVLNLADSQEVMEAYEGYADTYYATITVAALDMGVDFTAEDFNAKLKTGLETLLASEGPYLVHCTEGKDRAGFVTALLAAASGAEVSEIVDDYMLSFENYYHVENGSDRWNRIATSNIIQSLCTIAGVETQAELEAADLQAGAETYLVETVGLTAEQVAALQTALTATAAVDEAA